MKFYLYSKGDTNIREDLYKVPHMKFVDTSGEYDIDDASVYIDDRYTYEYLKDLAHGRKYYMYVWLKHKCGSRFCREAVLYTWQKDGIMHGAFAIDSEDVYEAKRLCEQNAYIYN